MFSAGELFEYAEANYRIGGEFYLIDGRTRHGDIADLSLLASMPNLEELYLCRQAIRDVSVLEGLPLTTLVLNENDISDLAPLSSLTQLQTLSLIGNPATDYSALARLTNLRQLSLGGARSQRGMADSLSFLEALSLRELTLGGLTVPDGNWRPLTGQNLLDMLEVWDPPAEAMEAINGLSGLRELRLGDYAHRDLTMLTDLSGLDRLIIRNLESLEGIQAMTGLYHLRVHDSGLSDLSLLSGLGRLGSVCLINVPNADYTTLPKGSVLDELRVDEAQIAAVEAACPGHTFHVLPN